MTSMIMTTYLASSFEGVSLIVLPIIGSIMIAYAVFEIVKDLRKSEHHKLMERLEGKATGKTSTEQAHGLLRKGSDDGGTNALDNAVRKLHMVPKLQQTLDQANLPWSASHTLINLAGLSFLGFLGSVILGKGYLIGCGLAVGVFVLPMIYFSRRRARRLNKLVRQLPDVFELMSQALAAGHSLASAIQLIGEQMPDPAGTEFARVFHEQNLGIKVEDALLNMANRIDMLDLRFFVTAVLISRQSGGDLGEVLDKISSVIRERIELFGQVKTLTAEGRMSGWVLFALPIIVFAAAMMFNPDYAGVLITDPRGKMLLGVALGMQLMGLGMIRYIVNIRV